MKYHYKAKTQNGESKCGYISADNEQQVLNHIRANGWYPVDISRRPDSSALLKAVSDLSADTVSLKSKSIFFRQFSVLLTSGIPMEKALELLLDQSSDGCIKKTVRQLHNDIIAGQSVAASMSGQAKIFDRLEIAFIRAGEESGRLDESLLKIAELLKKQNEIRRQVVSALIYPAVILAVTLAVLVLMTVFVMPQFENTFYQMHIEMPLFTRIVFSAGRFIRSYWFLVPLIFFAVSITTACLSHSDNYRQRIDLIKLKLPLFGKIIFKASAARAFRTMATLLASGVDLLRAIELSGDAAGNVIIKNIFNSMLLAAKDGSSLYNTIGEGRMFPVLAAQLVKIGEETGHIDEKFMELAGIYEEEVDDAASALRSVLEPVMVVFVSLIVAVMLFAAYMPIISAIKNLI